MGKVQRQPEWTPEQQATALAAHRGGMTCEEISALLGGTVGPKAVAKRLYRLCSRVTPYSPNSGEREQEPQIDSVWSFDEDRRRIAFAKRASQGAREQLAAIAMEAA